MNRCTMSTSLLLYTCKTPTSCNALVNKHHAMQFHEHYYIVIVIVPQLVRP